MKSHFAKGCFLVLLVLSLIGCGGTGQAEGTNIPNALHVVLMDSVSGYHFAPLDTVIHAASQVQDLYKAAYALQTIPSGEVLHCPSDNGLEYHLDFLRETTPVQQMTLDATGCQLLDLNATGIDFLGINTHDVRFTTPSFLALFAKMLNLSSLSPSDN